MEREENMECAARSATCGGIVTFRVAMASDAVGIGACATVLASLLEHTEGPVEVRIFSRDVEPVTVRSGRLVLEVMWVPEELQWLSLATGQVDGGGCDWTAALACCGDWKRALVLGPERLVVSDPVELFEMELGDSYVAARVRPGVELRDMFPAGGIGLSADQADMVGSYRYFEGAVVVNLAAMRQEGVFDRLLELRNIGGMNGNAAFCAACGDRVMELDRRLVSISRWNEIGADSVIVDFSGAATPEGGGPLWQAHATTWQELTCRAWCPVPLDAAETQTREDVLQSLIVSNRLPGRPLRVLEIGGWDFERMLSVTTQWMETETDHWSVIFRAHVEYSALEEAIQRFGDSLADLASRTEVLDGSSAEILAWLMTQEERWERMDAVVIHVPGRAGKLLTEAVMSWNLLRPGGIMVLLTDELRGIPAAAVAFERALDGFLGAIASGGFREQSSGMVAIRKEALGSSTQTMGSESQTGSPVFFYPPATRKPVLIVQASPPRTGSTVLNNLLFGLVAPTRKVQFSLDMTEVPPFEGNVAIVKTHAMDIERIIAMYGNRFDLYFVCSERGGDGVDEAYHQYGNVLRVAYDDLLESEGRSLAKIVKDVHDRLAGFLPAWIFFDQAAALGRLRRMNEFYQTIRHLPFAYHDEFFRLHGSHRNRG